MGGKVFNNITFTSFFKHQRCFQSSLFAFAPTDPTYFVLNNIIRTRMQYHISMNKTSNERVADAMVGGVSRQKRRNVAGTKCVCRRFRKSQQLHGTSRYFAGGARSAADSAVVTYAPNDNTTITTIIYNMGIIYRRGLIRLVIVKRAAYCCARVCV